MFVHPIKDVEVELVAVAEDRAVVDVIVAHRKLQRRIGTPDHAVLNLIITVLRHRQGARGLKRELRGGADCQGVEQIAERAPRCRGAEVVIKIGIAIRLQG